MPLARISISTVTSFIHSTNSERAHCTSWSLLHWWHIMDINTASFSITIPTAACVISSCVRIFPSMITIPTQFLWGNVASLVCTVLRKATAFLPLFNTLVVSQCSRDSLQQRCICFRSQWSLPFQELEALLSSSYFCLPPHAWLYSDDLQEGEAVALDFGRAVALLCLPGIFLLLQCSPLLLAAHEVVSSELSLPLFETVTRTQAYATTLI